MMDTKQTLQSPPAPRSASHSESRTASQTTPSPAATSRDAPATDSLFDPQTEYRKLPAVDVLLRKPQIVALADEYGSSVTTGAVRTSLEEARAGIASGIPAPAAAEWPARIEMHLHGMMAPSLRPLINATGVIIHTNLGRAPLSAAARRAVSQVSRAYSNLEYDLDAGARGSRYDHARALLCELTGAEDALVVNNCASAIYLALTALCRAHEVLISRSQLVEIGGGFRIPDVLRQSGAQLVEVGTTNRTHARDFADAVTDQTAALMRVHSSNFRQIGFTTMPTLAEMAEIAHGPPPAVADVTVSDATELASTSLLLIDDLGSGTLIDTRHYGLEPEPMVQESIAAGADVVAFSGDKLLGGPQAGILVGRTELIGALRRHPMARALRVDKMVLAALEATLHSYRRGRATTEIPVWQMISASLSTLGERAIRWQRVLSEKDVHAYLWNGESAIGGGSLPGETLPTMLLVLSPAALGCKGAAEAASLLRSLETPVLCRIQQEHLVFDPRTVLPEQDSAFLDALIAACDDAAASQKG